MALFLCITVFYSIVIILLSYLASSWLFCSSYLILSHHFEDILLLFPLFFLCVLLRLFCIPSSLVFWLEKTNLSQVFLTLCMPGSVSMFSSVILPWPFNVGVSVRLLGFGALATTLPTWRSKVFFVSYYLLLLDFQTTVNGTCMLRPEFNKLYRVV